MSRFKDKTLEERARILEFTRTTYPGKVCIIVEKSRQCRDPKIAINRTKYLVEPSTTCGQLISHIRKEIKNIDNQAIFILIVDEKKKGIYPILSASVSEMHRKYQHTDGFMYMEFLLENTFGGCPE